MGDTTSLELSAPRSMKRKLSPSPSAARKKRFPRNAPSKSTAISYNTNHEYDSATEGRSTSEEGELDLSKDHSTFIATAPIAPAPTSASGDQFGAVFLWRGRPAVMLSRPLDDTSKSLLCHVNFNSPNIIHNTLVEEILQVVFFSRLELPRPCGDMCAFCGEYCGKWVDSVSVMSEHYLGHMLVAVERWLDGVIASATPADLQKGSTRMRFLISKLDKKRVDVARAITDNREGGLCRYMIRVALVMGEHVYKRKSGDGMYTISPVFELGRSKITMATQQRPKEHEVPVGGQLGKILREWRLKYGGTEEFVGDFARI